MLPSNDEGAYKPTLSFDMARLAQKMTRPTILLLRRVFFFARTCLLSPCLAPNGGIHIQTHRQMGGIYEVRY
jgi:hypothetical protein